MRAIHRALGALGLVAVLGATGYVVSGHTTATVSSDAMRPTYAPGDRVFLERTEAGSVRRGDVVLHRSQDRYGGLATIHRVVGVGGDRVAQRPGGPVMVNGKPLAEPYVQDGDPSGTAPAYDVVVPEGRLFLLGDHRANSRDSRYFLDEQSGTVAERTVLARVPGDRSGLVGAGLAVLLGLALVAGAIVAEVTGRRRRTAGRPYAR
ncbi:MULTISPECIES: signal peptidase I [Streptomyces]|uniref:Signal peptidase I n=1 Tax=Streptomyces sudanensis TaxID=436397 RepID=A0ABY4TJU4_9ACTN|nr:MULTISPECIES: signal peptidase I [Streptomyces]URN17275.1 signal peptidase I [Streptomyces sudanensis]